MLRPRIRGQLGAKRGPKLDAKVRKILTFGAPKWRYPFLGIPYLNLLKFQAKFKEKSVFFLLKARMHLLRLLYDHSAANRMGLDVSSSIISILHSLSQGIKRPATTGWEYTKVYL